MTGPFRGTSRPVPRAGRWLRPLRHGGVGIGEVGGPVVQGVEELVDGGLGLEVDLWFLLGWAAWKADADRKKFSMAVRLLASSLRPLIQRFMAYS